MKWKNKVYSVDDFRVVAKTKLPPTIFDFIDGGAGKEVAVERNLESLTGLKLLPRIGNDVKEVDLSTIFCEKTYSAPFGIAPLGLSGLIHPQADLYLAQISARNNIPFIVSSVASNSVEKISEAAGEAPWFQLYVPKSLKELDLLIARVDKLECPVLTITVDTAAPGNRLRDLRNGFSLPFKPIASSPLNAMLHPNWTLNQIAGGEIGFPNFTPQKEGDIPFNELMSRQTGGVLDWAMLTRIRERWPRKILLKGVLSAEDALIARDMGIDGVIVSSHGGRQLSSVPAPIDVLPSFVSKGISEKFISLDSGFRSGEDIVKGIALGSSMVFIGRPFLYALASGGEAGGQYLVDILKEELKSTMRLLGLNEIAKITRSYCQNG